MDDSSSITVSSMDYGVETIEKVDQAKDFETPLLEDGSGGEKESGSRKSRPAKPAPVVTVGKGDVLICRTETQKIRVRFAHA